MTRYQLGDRVRIDIPDETDTDYQFHGEHGVVINVETVVVYSVALDDQPVVLDAYDSDIRPSISDASECP